MSILKFDKPKKIQSTEKHNQIHSSDSGVAGTYVPNMSRKNMEVWKAKKIGGTDSRIEIRKSISGIDPILAEKQKKRGYVSWRDGKPNSFAQLLVIVRPDGSINMSANGKLSFNAETWAELQMAIFEATEILNNCIDENGK